MTSRSRLFGAFRKRLDALMKASRRIDDGDVEGVHQARVASRRLRELVPVLGLRDESAQKLGRRLKKVTKQLGTVRELDVVMLMTQELALDSRYPVAALEQVSGAVARDCGAEHDSLRTKLPSHKIQSLAGRLQRAAGQRESAHGDNPQGTPPPVRVWAGALEARATRRAAAVRCAIETAGTVYIPERLHDVRIAVKKLRYALEIAAETRLRRGSRDIAVLKAAQDSLGRLHDLEILIGRARQEQVSLSPATLTAWRELDVLVAALEEDCRALHAVYLRDRVKLMAIADRICDPKRPGAIVNRRAAG